MSKSGGIMAWLAKGKTATPSASQTTEKKKTPEKKASPEKTKISIKKGQSPQKTAQLLSNATKRKHSDMEDDTASSDGDSDSFIADKNAVAKRTRSSSSPIKAQTESRKRKLEVTKPSESSDDEVVAKESPDKKRRKVDKKPASKFVPIDVEEESEDEKPAKKIKKDEKEVKKKTPEKKTEKKKTPEKKDPEEKPKRKWNNFKSDNHGAALNPGSKTVPIGKPDCLKSKAFVLSGNLESLGRKEAEDLIKQYGGVIRQKVTSRTTYLLAGEGVADSKLEDAKKHKTKQITEDDFLEMLRKSNPDGQAPTQPAAQAPSPVKEEAKDIVAKFTHGEIHKKKENTLAPAVRHTGDIQLWVDKFAPTKVADIIGNAKLVNELKDWLKTWETKYQAERKSGEKVKKSTAFKRAVMISGVPGIGKTTSAKLICQDLGFNVVELNASDARNKKSLKEEVEELTDNRSLKEFFTVKKAAPTTKKTVLVMDEVDGMSAGDRGGVAELIAMIKTTKIPIICICNDRSKQSLKTLLTHTLEFRYARPDKGSIVKRLEQICRQQKLQIDTNALMHLVESLQNDIRSIINNLQLLSNQHEGKRIDYNTAKNEDIKKSDSQASIFDVTKDLLQTPMPIKDAMELYYFDSMLVPLFVAENYISIIPNNVKDGSQDHIDRLADASASIAYGDILGKKIFRDQNWAISNDVAYVGTAKPARIMRGRKVNLKDSYGYYNFPSSLSKGSTTTKSYNILRGIQKASIHMASLSQRDSLDYLPLLRDTFLAPLIEDKKEGIEAAIAAMDEYGITKDDVEAIDEMATFKGKIGKQKYSDIETAVKSSFTREFNKTHKAINKGKLSKITNEDNEELNDEEKALVEDEDDLDKLANDLAKKKKEEVRLKSFDKKQQKAEEKKTKTKSKKKDSSPKEKKEPKKKLSLKKK